MSNWIQVKGRVQEGYGVASGKSGSPRFPGGTIQMQKAFFQERGLDLEGYFPGTINFSIAPHRYELLEPKYTFRGVKWSPNDPAEDFSFMDCRILVSDTQVINGLIYYPHPETKPEHIQPPTTLEIISPLIEGLTYGAVLTIEVDSQQMRII